MPKQRHILDFFRQSLARFQHSDSPFALVTTLRDSQSSQAQDAALPVPPSAEPVASPGRLIVLDSSFNPPTIAHMRMAHSAIQSLSPDTQKDARLLLLLAVKNADKAAKPVSFEQRLALMWAFAADLQRPNIPIDIGLTTFPFFHDKSAAIAASPFYKDTENGQGTEHTFLAGYDTLIRIFNPKYYAGLSPDSSSEHASPMQAALDPFFARARLRITMRPDDEWGDMTAQQEYLKNLDNLEESGGRKRWAERVEMVEGRRKEEMVVSSTLARKAAKESDWTTLEKFVGPHVRKLIEQECLYVGDED